jgi:two-component system NarL family response regulator
MTETIRIVLVEDHYTTLEGLTAGLEREEGFVVVGACANSDEGLALVEQHRPDVAVLDLHLPGTRAPREMIQEYLRYPLMKIVVFSAENRMAYIQSVVTMGVSAYLLKSERVAKVAETIRKVMKGQTGIVSEDLSFDFKRITASEQEVLHMLGLGMKYQEIADQRGTSIATARKQCEVLLLKLSLDSREQLIAWAVKNGYGAVEANR